MIDHANGAPDGGGGGGGVGAGGVVVANDSDCTR